MLQGRFYSTFWNILSIQYMEVQHRVLDDLNYCGSFQQVRIFLINVEQNCFICSLRISADGTFFFKSLIFAQNVNYYNNLQPLYTYTNTIKNFSLLFNYVT